MILPGRQRDRSGPDGASLGHQVERSRRRLGRVHRQVDRETLAGKGGSWKISRRDAEARGGPARQQDCVDRNVQDCGKLRGSRRRAFGLCAVGHQHETRDAPGGKGCGGLPDRCLDARRAPCLARGGMKPPGSAFRWLFRAHSACKGQLAQLVAASCAPGGIRKVIGPGQRGVGNTLRGIDQESDRLFRLAHRQARFKKCDEARRDGHAFEHERGQRRSIEPRSAPTEKPPFQQDEDQRQSGEPFPKLARQDLRHGRARQTVRHACGNFPAEGSIAGQHERVDPLEGAGADTHRAATRGEEPQRAPIQRVGNRPRVLIGHLDHRWIHTRGQLGLHHAGRGGERAPLDKRFGRESLQQVREQQRRGDLGSQLSPHGIETENCQWGQLSALQQSRGHHPLRRTGDRRRAGR